MRTKDLLSLWAGKAVAFGCHAAKRGGSSLPGLLVNRLNPGFVKSASSAQPYGNVIVTGTNGKTTTARMILCILREAGLRPAHNRTGANLMSGIATTFVETYSLGGRPRSDIGLLEVDEATVPRACAELKVAGLVVTNLFRDQLDRFGELDHTLALIRKGLEKTPEGTFVAVNADDPLVASLGAAAGTKRRMIYYGWKSTKAADEGIEPNEWIKPSKGIGIEIKEAADIRHCLHCGNPYLYREVHYAHLGVYECQACGSKRPDPTVALIDYRSEAEAAGKPGGSVTGLDGPVTKAGGCVTEPGGSVTKPCRSITEPSDVIEPPDATDPGNVTEPAGSVINVATPLGPLEARISVPGVYNLYNALAAISAAIGLGIDLDTIRRGLLGFRASFGRMEVVEVGDKRVFLALVKNPAGYNQVIRTLLQTEGEKNLVLCINDNYADGRDVSWLWDVDFEALAQSRDRIRFIITSGIRAFDMAVRLKYAGFDESLITTDEDLRRALSEGVSRTPPRGTLYVLPTYTAMLEVRKILQRSRCVKPFWRV
ncbi:MAG TPA: DUF1727 domain-containing protein [Clostridia bacterium]|nr:DUF1727 domain-containing protein [Clostridia bacterium]